MDGMRRDESVSKVRFAGGLQAISLFLLVAVVALRPLVSETYDSAGNSITRAVEVLADPSPARTLGFDLTILIATCLWLLAFALDRAVRYRWTGLEIGLALLAIAGGVSCYFAGNKRLAINGTVDWICLPILAITLVQLLRTQWQRRVVLAAILASATVNAAQCYEQYFLGFAETIEQYEAGKVAFWAKQGVELDSTTVDAFERRLRAREATGFFAHSNVAGAYLMLCWFAVIGIGVAWYVELKSEQEQIEDATVPSKTNGPRGNAVGTKAPNKDIVTWSLLVAGSFFLLFIQTAMLETGSVGTMISWGAGMALLMFAWRKRDWFAANVWRGFAFSWILLGLAAAFVIEIGQRDMLPGWSLKFRWQYWKASAAMIADHFSTGVGRENFGRHYTLYKDIASPEEVSNPHNFFVQAAAEWGILGLTAVVAMVFGVSYLCTRRSSRGLPVDDTIGPGESSRTGESRLRGRVIPWIVALGLTIILGRASLLGSDDPNYIYYVTATTGLIWLIGFVVFYGVSIEFKSEKSWVGFPWCLGAGLLAFLLQDMISFALFIPASATTFFALLAVWLSAARHENASKAVPASPFTRLLVSVFAAAMAVGFAFFLLSPVIKAESQRESAEAILPDGNSTLYYRMAQAADPLDPTNFVEEARFLASQDNTMVLKLALQSLSQAQARDPFNATLLRMEMQIHSRMAMLSGYTENHLGAVQAAKAALALYPQDPAGLVLLADTELVAGRELQSKELLLAAVGHYQEALALDEKRLEWETIHRFRPRVVDEIHAKIRSAESALADLQ